MNPTPSPRCVILAVDPGKTGGWCIRHGAGYFSGTAKTAAERAAVVRSAMGVAAVDGIPLVAVVEQWTAGGKRGHAQWVGIGAARGRWLEALELGGVTRLVGVFPQTWRKVLAPLPRRTGEQAKASARLIARGLLKREVGTDEAEAVCIARWSETSPEVATIAARKTRKRAA